MNVNNVRINVTAAKTRNEKKKYLFSFVLNKDNMPKMMEIPIAGIATKTKL